MSQEGRLKGMEYLDFVLFTKSHGLRIKEPQDAKAEGKNCGNSSAFVPEELTLAAECHTVDCARVCGQGRR
ncbi:MAG: hypothetical protein R2941_07340 [Desulfobacterales bacterium]